MKYEDILRQYKGDWWCHNMGDGVYALCNAEASNRYRGREARDRPVTTIQPFDLAGETYQAVMIEGSLGHLQRRCDKAGLSRSDIDETDDGGSITFPATMITEVCTAMEIRKRNKRYVTQEEKDAAAASLAAFRSQGERDEQD